MTGIPPKDPQEMEAVNQSWQVKSVSEPGREGRTGSPEAPKCCWRRLVQPPSPKSIPKKIRTTPAKLTFTSRILLNQDPTGEEFPESQVELGKKKNLTG